jgi:3-oxoadipate enol-lactonase
MAMVTLNAVELNYRLEGDGPETIVLVNGLADDLETWFEQVPDLLAAGYRVLRFDNRGIGKSGRPKGPYTTAQMAADAKALVDHLAVKEFHLVGVSMGGMISQEYALAYGGDLRSLALCCTYATPGPFCSRMFALWRDMAPVMGVPAVMRDVTLWAFTQEFFEQREATLKEFEAAMASLDQPVEAYLAQLHSIEAHDTTARLGGIKTPTLVLAGESDILIPMQLGRRLCQAIPGAEWAVSKGGHAFLWEHPKPFNEAVLRFIAKHRR